MTDNSVISDAGARIVIFLLCILPMVVMVISPRTLGWIGMIPINILMGILRSIENPTITMTKLPSAKYEIRLTNEGIQYSENGIPCHQTWTGSMIKTMLNNSSGDEHTFWYRMYAIWHKEYE